VLAFKITTVRKVYLPADGPASRKHFPFELIYVIIFFFAFHILANRAVIYSLNQLLRHSLHRIKIAANSSRFRIGLDALYCSFGIFHKLSIKRLFLCQDTSLPPPHELPVL
jgi:hypothetical protein